ncbi:MAG TPA: copper chaperone PCu(A)C, partial [Bacillota bacterium]
RAAVVAASSLLVALVLTACGSPGTAGSRDLTVTADITINDPWARPAPAGDNSAAYFEIRNGAAEADTLTGVSADVADMVGVHQSRVEDGIVKMEHVESLVIPAGESVTLEPGGYHVMIMGLRRDLQVGETFQLDLHFERAGTVTVDVAVREP